MQLEEFRRARLNELASLIQNTFRAWSARSTFQRRRLAQILIANAWRRYKVRSGYVYVSKYFTCFYWFAQRHAHIHNIKLRMQVL